MLKKAILTIWTILAVVLFSYTWYGIGRLVEKQTNPVCYAITEDSDISGCDYRNGAWYRK